MSIQKSLEKIKTIQGYLLNFLDEDLNSEEDSQNLNNLFEDKSISENKHDLDLFLRLLIKIANNHHRGSNFYNKIEQILKFFKESIKNLFSNSEIFNIFKSNKRILLYIIEEKLIVLNKQIINKITSLKYGKNKYPLYFTPEIQEFIQNNGKTKSDSLNDKILKEIPEGFYENRKKGENESIICELIRNDSIKEFIVYINKNGYSVKTEIENSIYETNQFLNSGFTKNNDVPYYRYNRNQDNNKPTLIEYAAFFGSIQIFRYLLSQKIELKPSIWLYAVHGQNAEIIGILEDNKIVPKDNTYKECYLESIKCHHNDTSNYIQYNLMQSNSNENLFEILKYYNFAFIDDNDIDQSSFYYLCKYNYNDIVANLLKEKNIDVNRTISKIE